MQSASTPPEKSHHYEGEKGRQYFLYQNKRAALGAKLNSEKFQSDIQANDCVVDFGCGGGWLLHELKCNVRIGVEPNEEAHESCRQNNITVYRTVGAIPNTHIDVVISHHCLEHVIDPVRALRELSGILKTSGLLILVVPIDEWRVQRDYAGKDIDHHLYTWTPRLIANLLSEAGFRVVEVRILNHAWFPGWHRCYGKMPNIVFDLICTTWSILRQRRQLRVKAIKIE